MDKQKLYRKVILDFANAPSFNEGFFTLLENIPAALEFSPKATEKVRAYRPSCLLTPKNDPQYEYRNFERERGQSFFDFGENVVWVLSKLASGLKLSELTLKGDDLPPMSPLEPFLVIYNGRFRPIMELAEDELMLGKSSLLNERSFLLDLEIGSQGTTLLYALAYCLIEFLKVPTNRSHVRQCPVCNKFFLAKNLKRTRCYSSSCEKAYQRERKQRQREGDPVKYV
jgi:hypothetical protein